MGFKDSSALLPFGLNTRYNPHITGKCSKGAHCTEARKQGEDSAGKLPLLCVSWQVVVLSTCSVSLSLDYISNKPSHIQLGNMLD